jgi:hypothetical protein
MVPFTPAQLPPSQRRLVLRPEPNKKQENNADAAQRQLYGILNPTLVMAYVHGQPGSHWDDPRPGPARGPPAMGHRS